MASKLHAGRVRVNEFLWNRRNTTGQNVKNGETLESSSQQVQRKRAATTSHLTICNNDVLLPEGGLKLGDKPVVNSKKRWIPLKTKSPTPSTNSHLEKSQTSKILGFILMEILLFQQQNIVL